VIKFIFLLLMDAGITPLRVIGLELLSKGVPVVLLYSVRHPEEAAFLQEFTDLAAAYSTAQGADLAAAAGEGTGPSFSVLVAITGARPGGKRLPVGMLQGRIDRQVIVGAVPNVTACDVYLCGPAAFLSAMETELVAAGAQQQRIYTESFSF
jgi:ferredoxin-NADP reductase